MGKGERGELVQRIKTIREEGLFPLYMAVDRGEYLRRGDLRSQRGL